MAKIPPDGEDGTGDEEHGKNCRERHEHRTQDGHRDVRQRCDTDGGVLNRRDARRTATFCPDDVSLRCMQSSYSHDGILIVRLHTFNQHRTYDMYNPY